MSADEKKRRQVSGCLLIASNEYVLHTCNGVEGSWLSTANPSRFLLKRDDVSKMHSCEFRNGFLLPAMHAPFPDFVLDILVDKNGEIVYRQGIVLLRVPEGMHWDSAKQVCNIPWHDIVTTEGEKCLWREWSDSWFRNYSDF